MNKLLEIIDHMGQRPNNSENQCVFILVSYVTSYPDKKTDYNANDTGIQICTLDY